MISRLNSETPHRYMSREAVTNQITTPACSHAETTLFLQLLKIIRGEVPELNNFRSPFIHENETHLIRGLALQKKVGLDSRLILTGQFAGFLLWRNGRVLRPILKESILDLELIENCYPWYIGYPEFSATLQQYTNVLADSSFSLQTFLFETLNAASVRYNQQIMSRNINNFQDMIDLEY